MTCLSSNVVQAMGVRCHPLLGHLKGLLDHADSCGQMGRSVEASLASECLSCNRWSHVLIFALSPAAHISPNLRLLLRIDQLVIKAVAKSVTIGK